MCPSDYDDARQTDSDCGNDPEYRPEVENPPATPASPQLTGGEGPSTSTADRRTQRQKNKQARLDSLDAARKELKAISHLLTSPTREEDDDEISRPKPPKKGNTNVIRLVWYGTISKSLVQVLRRKYNVIIVLNIGVIS